MANSNGRYQCETEQQKQAFEIYYKMGRSRAYSKIASQFSVSIGTIKNWGRSFDWQQRVEVKEATRTSSISTSSQQQDRVRIERIVKLVEAATVLTLKNAAAGNVRSTIGDFIALIETWLALEGVTIGKSASKVSTAPGGVLIYAPGE